VYDPSGNKALAHYGRSVVSGECITVDALYTIMSTSPYSRPFRKQPWVVNIVDMLAQSACGLADKMSP
jgi:hypothetical protein